MSDWSESNDWGVHTAPEHLRRLLCAVPLSFAAFHTQQQYRSAAEHHEISRAREDITCNNGLTSCRDLIGPCCAAGGSAVSQPMCQSHMCMIWMSLNGFLFNHSIPLLRNNNKNLLLEHIILKRWQPTDHTPFWPYFASRVNERDKPITRGYELSKSPWPISHKVMQIQSEPRAGRDVSLER